MTSVISLVLGLDYSRCALLICVAVDKNSRRVSSLGFKFCSSKNLFGFVDCLFNLVSSVAYHLRYLADPFNLHLIIHLNKTIHLVAG